ncbi:BolA-like protein 2 [Merluccius polli]|uniref:BolA-like protein 2 n=1 Tax=Merluccius polli TaxID=89951 RepID=A0AA47NB49_MERPO|nr:BolA-like protein 2 [Merluccius polli]
MTVTSDPRLVNGVLAEELKDIHAFEQKTLTPQQWETQKSQSEHEAERWTTLRRTARQEVFIVAWVSEGTH